MAIMAISKAVSASISRSVAASELKHKAKMEDLTISIGIDGLLRKDKHAERLTNARYEHTQWLSNLDEVGKSIHQQSVNDLDIIINGKATEA